MIPRDQKRFHLPRLRINPKFLLGSKVQACAVGIAAGDSGVWLLLGNEQPHFIEGNGEKVFAELEKKVPNGCDLEVCYHGHEILVLPKPANGVSLVAFAEDKFPEGVRLDQYLVAFGKVGEDEWVGLLSKKWLDPLVNFARRKVCKSCKVHAFPLGLQLKTSMSFLDSVWCVFPSPENKWALIPLPPDQETMVSKVFSDSEISLDLERSVFSESIFTWIDPEQPARMRRQQSQRILKWLTLAVLVTSATLWSFFSWAIGKQEQRLLVLGESVTKQHHLMTSFNRTKEEIEQVVQELEAERLKQDRRRPIATTMRSIMNLCPDRLWFSRFELRVTPEGVRTCTISGVLDQPKTAGEFMAQIHDSLPSVRMKLEKLQPARQDVLKKDSRFQVMETNGFFEFEIQLADL